MVGGIACVSSRSVPHPRPGDRRRVYIQLESVERGRFYLIAAALLGHGVLAVFIFMAAAMIGVALVVGLYGPKTKALAWNKSPFDEYGLYRLMKPNFFRENPSVSF